MKTYRYYIVYMLYRRNNLIFDSKVASLDRKITDHETIKRVISELCDMVVDADVNNFQLLSFQLLEE